MKRAATLLLALLALPLAAASPAGPAPVAETDQAGRVHDTKMGITAI